MSPYSTSSPSTEHTRLYFTRPPSVAWTWWKRMSWSSVAEYSFTPMLTSPKETAPFQIDRTLPPVPGPRRPAAPQDHRIGPGTRSRQAEDGRHLHSPTRTGDRRSGEGQLPPSPPG